MPTATASLLINSKRDSRFLESSSLLSRTSASQGQIGGRQDDSGSHHRAGQSSPPDLIYASDKLIALRFKLIFFIEVWKSRQSFLFHNSPCPDEIGAGPSYLKRGRLGSGAEALFFMTPADYIEHPRRSRDLTPLILRGGFSQASPQSKRDLGALLPRLS
jgi:hypothetical protein